MYHNPVLLDQSIKGLNIDPEGIYVDATFGGGGHSKKILDSLEGGMLYAFDMDQDAIKNKINHKNFKCIHANYKHMKRFLKLEGVISVNGILADLGISSYQIDSASRGFSFRFNSNLDMRMNINSPITGQHVINKYSEEELSNVFYNYGEIRESKRVSRKIVEFRKKHPIITTMDLKNVLDSISPYYKKKKFFSKVFQSIRIEVNDEINSLKEMLLDGVSLLKSRGRFVVLSYHSLEDRLVKNLFKRGNLEGNIESDLFGNSYNNLNDITKKVIVASEEEKQENPRSRSVRLRIAEKI